MGSSSSIQFFSRKNIGYLEITIKQTIGDSLSLRTQTKQVSEQNLILNNVMVVIGNPTTAGQDVIAFVASNHKTIVYCF